MAHHELNLATNEACRTGNGYFEAKVYVRAGRRRVRSQQIDLGLKAPPDDPIEALRQVQRHMSELEQRFIVAVGLQRVCLRRQHEVEPKRPPSWSPSARLERVASYIVATGDALLYDVNTPSESLIPSNGIGTLGIRDMPLSTMLDPVVFLPAYSEHPDSHPVHQALEVTHRKEGGIYVALRGLEKVIARDELYGAK